MPKGKKNTKAASAAANRMQPNKPKVKKAKATPRKK